MIVYRGNEIDRMTVTNPMQPYQSTLLLADYLSIRQEDQVPSTSGSGKITE